MRVLIALSALASICLLEYPTRAQDMRSRVRRYEPAIVGDLYSLRPDEQARVVLDDYTACLIKYDKAGVLELLKISEDNPAFTNKTRSLVSEKCLFGGDLKFSQDMIRGSAYIALYRQDYPRTAPSIPETRIDWIKQIIYPAGSYTKSRAALLDFADCVVRKDPEHSRALVIGPTASKRETEAFSFLMPLLGPCMPAGVTLNVSKPMLFGLIAEAYYRDALSGREVQSAGVDS